MHAISSKTSLQLIASTITIPIALIIILSCSQISTITVTDPSPANLGMFLQIEDNYNNSEMTSLGIHFLLIGHSSTDLPSLQGVSLTCNNVTLQPGKGSELGSFYGNVPSVIPPNVYTITYHTKNTTATVVVPAVQATVISPVNDTSIALPTPNPATIPVTYRIMGLGQKGLVPTVYFGVSAYDGHNHFGSSPSIPFNSQSPALNTVEIDVSPFSPSNGKITVGGGYNDHPQTDFSNTAIEYNFTASVNITWT